MNDVNMVDVQTSRCIGGKGTRWDETLETREKPRPRSLDILVANAFYAFHDDAHSRHQSTEFSRMAYLLVESKPNPKSIIGSRPLTWGPAQSENFSIPIIDAVGHRSDFPEELIGGDIEINLTNTLSTSDVLCVKQCNVRPVVSEDSGAIFESDCERSAKERSYTEKMAIADWSKRVPEGTEALSKETGDTHAEETQSKLENSESHSDEINTPGIRSLSDNKSYTSNKHETDKRSSARSCYHSNISTSNSPLTSLNCDVPDHCKIGNIYPALKKQKSLENLSIELDSDQGTLSEVHPPIADSADSNNGENCFTSDDNVFEMTEQERYVSFKPLADPLNDLNSADNSTVITMRIPHLTDMVEIRREPKIIHCAFLRTSVTSVEDYVDDLVVEECVSQCMKDIVGKVEEKLLLSNLVSSSITQCTISVTSRVNAVPTLASLATKAVGTTNAISFRASKATNSIFSDVAIPSVVPVVPSLKSLAAAAAASKEISKSFENNEILVSKMSQYVQKTSDTTTCESNTSKADAINSSEKKAKPCPQVFDDLCLRKRQTTAEKIESKRKHRSMSDMYNEWYQKVIHHSSHQIGFEYKKETYSSPASGNDIVFSETFSAQIPEEDIDAISAIDVEERQEDNFTIMPIHSYDTSCFEDDIVIKHVEELEAKEQDNSRVEDAILQKDVTEENVQNASGLENSRVENDVHREDRKEEDISLHATSEFQEDVDESSSRQNATLLFDVIPTSPHLRASHSTLPDMRGLLMPVVVSSDSADDADVFSEEIDMVLERPSMRRQDSFGDQKVLPTASLTAVEFDMDLITGGFMPTNTATDLPSESDGTSFNEVTDRPYSESHSCRYGHCFSTASSPYSRPLSRDFPHSMDATVSKRDSAMSRGSELSTASSDTVIASEEELLGRKDSRSSSCGESPQLNDTVICENAFTSTTPIPGLELVRQSRKNQPFAKGDKKYPHKKVESPLVTSEKKNQSGHCEEYNFACRQRQVNDKPATQSNSTLMAAYGLRYSQDSLDKASSLFESEDQQENYSLSSSSASLFSKQSSQIAEEYDSQNCSSTCSSSPTSPSNSPRLNHHFLQELLRKDFMRPDKEVIRAEREAAEACNWLKSAGFPQYASLYEAGLFPVSLNEVGKDHDFLDEDHFESLLRRLNVLNKCATMKLDKIHPDLQTDEEEDDDEQCAISENWHYEQLNRRWSRLAYKNGKVFSEAINETNPSFYHQNTSDDDNRLTSAPLLNFVVDRKTSLPSSGGDASHDSAHSGSNNAKPKKSSNFLKREFKKFRSSSFRRKDKDNVNKPTSNSDPHGGKKEQKFKAMVISEPQLQSGHEKLERLRCVPIVDASSSSSDAFHASNYQHFNNQRIRNRKNSAHSVTSTSSSSAGGSSSAASTPAIRAKNAIQQKYRTRGHSIDEMSTDTLSPVLVHNQQYLSELAPSHHKQQNHSKSDNRVFFIPRSHTPGTFPNIMVDPMSPSTSPSLASASNEDVSSSPSSIRRYDSGYPLRSTQRSISDNSNRKRPVSIYDNIVKNQMNPAASAQDLLDILDPDSGNDALGYEEMHESVNGSDSFWSVDDIVEQAELLQQQIQNWEYGNDEKENNRFPLDYDQSVDTVDSITNSNSDISNANSSSVVNFDSEQANYGNAIRDKSKEEFPFGHYSSTRRWQSVTSQPLQLHNLSAGQLMILRRLSVLKLTALMEKYASGNNAGNGGNKTGNLSWSIPRFIRRIKVFDYKDKSVFGVPLLHNFQRLGQPIPNCILNAMEFVRTTALDQVGLFRKPGVKSRIQKLREACELDPDMSSFHEWNAYDVADMVKQYFRDLPDPIMTAKLSDTFTGIFLYVPTEMRLEALCAAVMMLPDENTEALRTLLWFLSDVASYADENQMTESNLAVCFAPSLFFHAHSNANHNSSSRQLQAPSPRVRKSSKHGTMALGKPDMRDMNNNMASNQCLTFMIKYVKELFKIPEDAMTQCRLSVMQQTHDVLAAELGYHNNEGLGRSSPEKCAEILNDFHAYVDRVTAQTVRDESRTGHNKLSGSGWTQIPSVQGSELCFKKVNDGNYLRLWRCRVEIEGVTIEQIMRRVMNERPLWDNQLLHCKVIDRPDSRSECLQVVRQSMTSHPNRDYCILRSWRTNQSTRDLTVIVELSTDHPNAPPQDGVRGVVLTSRYVIESSSSGVWASDSTSSTSSTGSNGSSTKCYLTHISRVDTKGRNPEWYNKAYGHIAMRQLLKIRESFRQQTAAMLYNNINNNNSNTNSNTRST